MIKYLLVFGLFLSLSTPLFGQSKTTINGNVADANGSKSPITHATVSIFKGQDSIATAFTLTDANGNYQIPALASGAYTLTVDAWRYERAVRQIQIGTQANMKIDSIFLSPTSEIIDVVEILAQRPPIIVRNDTIEFNANSFKALPDAFVEDLFKKLPGFEILPSGEIRVNNKSVNRILVDGRAFFGGDMAIALKQLPAFVVDKVQVMEDQMAKRENPLLDAQSTPQVINLTLKKEAKKGLFGKVYTGNGLKSLYDAGGIINTFRDTTQISILAYGNNLNRVSFSFQDLNSIGGFNRGGWSSYGINGDGSYIIDNMRFGGIDNGVQSSYGGGVNFNTVTPKGVKYNARYFYGNNQSDSKILKNETQYISNNQLISESNLIETTESSYHSLGASAAWTSKSKIEYRLNMGADIQPSNLQNTQAQETKNETMQLINHAQSTTNSDNRNISYNFYGDVYKKFKKTSRTIYIKLSGNNNRTDQELFNVSNTMILTPPASLQIIDQLRDQRTKTERYNLSFMYADLISKTLSLNSATYFNAVNDLNNLYTFIPNALGDYEILLPTLSDRFRQSGLKTSMSNQLSWKPNKDLSISGGIVLGNIHYNNTFAHAAPLKQRYNFLNPMMNLNYKGNTLTYSNNFREPLASQIQPFINNTNPLFITEGNPDLSAGRVHQFSIRLFKQSLAKNFHYGINGSVRLTKKPIIYGRSINTQGVQISSPINVPDTWFRSVSFFTNKTHKFNSNRLVMGLTVGYSHDQQWIQLNNVTSSSDNKSFSIQPNLSLYLKDKFEITNFYTIRFNRSDYAGVFSPQKFDSHRNDFKLIYRANKRLTVESQFLYMLTDQKLNIFDNSISMWTASITHAFMKQNRAQIKFSANDLLNTNKNRTTLITQNFIRNTQSNALGRYFLLNFNYNIQSFGEK